MVDFRSLGRLLQHTIYTKTKHKQTWCCSTDITLSVFPPPRTISIHSTRLFAACSLVAMPSPNRRQMVNCRRFREHQQKQQEKLK